jgi:hypothetical protein
MEEALPLSIGSVTGHFLLSRHWFQEQLEFFIRKKLFRCSVAYRADVRDMPGVCRAGDGRAIPHPEASRSIAP